MKFVELTLADGETIVSINPDKIVSVGENREAADVSTPDDIFIVKGTRAEVVDKLEAFALFNEKKQRERELEAASGTEITGTIEDFADMGDQLLQAIDDRNTDIQKLLHVIDCLHLSDDNPQNHKPEDIKEVVDRVRARYPKMKKKFEHTPGTLPTEPGFYEYRWPSPFDGKPPIGPSPWMSVEVIRVGDPNVPHGSALVVKDPNAANMPELSTYENAEWRKRKEPK